MADIEKQLENAVHRKEIETNQLLNCMVNQNEEILAELRVLNEHKSSEGMKYDNWRIDWAYSKRRGQYWQVAAVLFAAIAVSLDIIEPKQDFVIIYDRLANLLDSILRFVGV